MVNLLARIQNYFIERKKEHLVTQIRDAEFVLRSSYPTKEDFNQACKDYAKYQERYRQLTGKNYINFISWRQTKQ